MKDRRWPEYLNYGIPLYKAALRGDWEAAKQILSVHSECIAARITNRGDTALHVAAVARRTEFVSRLLTLIVPENIHLLALKNNIGNTALCLAAASGNVAIAKMMFHHDNELPLIRGNQRLTPLHMAALLGHREMVIYLLPLTLIHLSHEERVFLFISTINTDLYDISLEMLSDHPELAIARDENSNETPLHALATKRLKYLVNIFGGNEETIRQHKAFQIFHIAVKYRREKIFRLIYDIGAIKDLLAIYVEAETHNNMLHLAAVLPPSDRLNKTVSGAALQMQREMLWFKVVKNLVPQLAEDENAAEKTPCALFTEEHKKLRKEGEEWMRKTASSCSVVATLIAAVVFGAALKVPGSDNGAPDDDPLSHGGWLWVFAISDSLSLVSSTASILMFLSILTSRYAEEDFLQSLPRKLIIGLTLLFISIATMMIAFTATFNIIFKHGLLWIGTAALACIPIVLFAVQEFPLLLEVYRSTIGNAFIFKPQHQLFCEVHLPNN
ncbi:uncharacterized protein LOC110688878 [Chenopodium quinoa]|uniref:uncharacterized protein LOC110688878 n=1 Tax=Chenopodium quinoa TaxID=63459 RepID=UPI000B787B6F|nr:uncharacterized protein LOC110688878 [Chenopodium quinoa]